MERLLETVEHVARSMGAGIERIAVEGDGGDPVETLVVTHAGSRIVAIAREDSIQLVCVEYLGPDARDLLRDAPKGLAKNLIALVRREGSQGRSRFDVAFEAPETGPELSEFVVEQRVFLVEPSAESRQRTADALVEISTIAARVRMALDAAIDTLAGRARPAETDFHDGMYH